MRTWYWIYFTGFAVACNQEPQTESLQPDTPVDTLLASETLGYSETGYEDYQYRKWIPSKFKKNQITEGVFFVYDPDGLVGQTNEDSIYIKPGTALTVLSEFDKNIADEKRNTTGKLWEVVNPESGTLMVNSASLLPIPHPVKKYENLEAYALNQLHLVDSVKYNGRRHQTEPGMHEGEYETIEYQFEKSIVLTLENGYESGAEWLKIPGMTIEQGFYFFNALGIINLFEIFDGKIPSEQVKLDYDETNKEHFAITTAFDENGKLTQLEIAPEDYGCGCYYMIQYIEDVLNIGLECGC